MTLEYLQPLEGFLGLPEDEICAPEEAGAVVIPYGLEASVTYGGGTQAGPAAVLEASGEVETFDELYWREPVHAYGIGTLVPPEIPDGIEPALERLSEVVSAVLDEGKFPLVIGGEHSVTPGALRPHLQRHNDLVLLHFDAHADLRDGYLGERYSHASAIRRCLDDPSLTVVSVGVRNISVQGARYLEDHPGRVHMHWGTHRAHYDPRAICAPLAGRPVYITFDLDGFDPSLLPATGTPEPGGLFWDDAMAILFEAARVSSMIVGADVVELAPIEGNPASNFVAARLCYRLMSLALLGPPTGPPQLTQP